MWENGTKGGAVGIMEDNTGIKRDIVFTGSFKRTLDEKSRMAVPARLRSQLERAQDEYECVYVVCVPGLSVIRIYTYDGWMRFAQAKIDAIEDPIEKHKMTEEVYKMVEEQRLDGQGRITINKNFAKKVGIKKNVQILGMGRGIQLSAAEDDEDEDLTISEAGENFITSLLF